MALSYKNWCICSFTDSAVGSARQPRPAVLRGSGRSAAALPLRLPRHSKHRATCLLPQSGPSQRLVAAQVAQAQIPEAAAVTSSNGHSSSSSSTHENHYAPPVLSASTMAVHGGENNGRLRQGVADSLTTPIVQTSTYTFKDTAELIAYQEGRHGSFEYGRYGNPTARVVEEKIMALEGAEDCLLSSSGMCSATTMLLALVPAGGHIVTTTDCYRRTRQFIQTVLPKMGISCTVIDPSDLKSLERALEQHQVSLFFSESPTNPYLRCVDIAAISKLCAKTNTVVCIDSTFATPVNSKALSFGADLVIHSATKYLAGHNDVLAGAICGSSDLVEQVRLMHNILGGVIDAHASYLLLRGMKTLGLRVEHQNRTALEIAKRLEAHPKIARVHYPGLPSHPDHDIAVKQMSGFGGVISFEVDGDLWRTAKFIDSVKIPYIAPSLGGVESLIEQPTVISYWDQGPEKRAEIGIKDSLVRYSCGVEGIEDLWEDIAQALEKI